MPREYRALLALIVAARKELNKYQSDNRDYFKHSAMVSQKAAALDAAMKEIANMSGAIAVEYHSDWLFSVLTREDVIREHEEFEALERKRKDNRCPL